MQVKRHVHANMDKKWWFNQAKLKGHLQEERRRKKEAEERNAQQDQRRNEGLPKKAAAFTKGVRLFQQRRPPFTKAAAYFMNQSASSRDT